ncbi:hypothetical protein N783_11175 [Pontibacillus marinus BH030004 = DSM 16465]|uniref:Uncharacterized protein n=1 Tax=Pontibacillus marinus BH030004 = DSM 16465 TaxID=1385511 RepID=A0A0A5GGX2_9BACI|nr:hypothetical protein N783_11175 [Pontibacillus marinus BH030004 = DSM 16465]
MPYYAFKEIWTPLKIFRIRLFRETHEKTFWMKVGNNPRKPLFG